MLKYIQIFCFFWCYFVIEVVPQESHSNCNEYEVTINSLTSEESTFVEFDCSNVTSLSTLNIKTENEFKKLIIFNSKLTKISPLDKYSFIEMLVLDEQGIEEIEHEAFRNLKKLKELSMKRNQISVLPARAFGENVETLDLRENVISVIDPEAFSGMNNLVVLYLDNNRISDLGEGLFKDCSKLKSFFGLHNEIRVINSKTFEGVEALETLDLSHNPISEIPNSLPVSENLYLDNCNLTVLSDLFFNSTPVVTFKAAHNKIEKLESKWFENANRLSDLDVSYNEISHFDAFPVVNNLSRLVISGNHLAALPVNLTSIFPNLNFLDVNVNRINKIEANTFINMPKLQELNISHNEISHIYENSLNEISKLDLSNNKLTGDVFDSLVHCCQTLQFLNLSNNEISNLDLSIFFKFENLTKVEFDNNQIKTLNNTNDGVVNIEELNLAHNKIENFQLSLFENFENVNTLDLSYNEISKIMPGALSSNSDRRLDYLYLDNNKITSIDSTWFQGNCSLNELYVRHNKIKKVEKDAITSECDVSLLDLSFNEISVLSENSFDSSTLHRLYLNHNNLTVLTDGIFGHQCIGLEWLYLSDNNIESIEPHVFSPLTGLQDLFLDNNRLTTLPDQMISSNYRLMYLQISHNKITTIPQNFFSQMLAYPTFNIRFHMNASSNNLKLDQPEIFSLNGFLIHSPKRANFYLDFRNNQISKINIEYIVLNFSNHKKPLDAYLELQVTLDKESCENLKTDWTFKEDNHCTIRVSRLREYSNIDI